MTELGVFGVTIRCHPELVSGSGAPGMIHNYRVKDPNAGSQRSISQRQGCHW
ncbi:hypothetical protein Theba_1779 [Mesotoga prima MesG1.Ag.4.2]|uniref:Uncharacterized protein n=1 Tax=Mesotoga prima MesG1.Ag.4.2 TaxID=660470 RepID=I2F678_9BACT|nr:hypothetical protein Theba_1779 [Mesotoga prima MesG1.Ag.4.2]